MKRLLILLFLFSASTVQGQYTGVGATSSGGGGAGGAPVDCSYVMMSSCVDTTVERILTGTAGRISLTDGGAGNAVTLDLVASGVTPGTYGDADDCVIITFDAYGRATNASTIACAGGGGGGAPTDLEYAVSVLSASLSAEDLLTGGAGLTFTNGSGTATFDVGAGQGITVNADDVAIASTTAGNGLTFTAGVLAVVSGNSAITVNANDITFNADLDMDVGVNAGTAAAPGLFFTDDTGNNTGLYRFGEDVIGISANGSLQLKVGITGLLPGAATKDIGSSTEAFQDGWFLRDITLVGSATPVADIVIRERDSDNGTDSISVRAPDSLAANWFFTLPIDDGTNGYVLTTDGNGVTSWAAGGGCSADAPVGAGYFTVGLDATLTGERDVTNIAGAGLTGTDGGANGTFVMAVGAGTCINANANDVAFNLACTGQTLSGNWTYSGTTTFSNLIDLTPIAAPAVSGNNNYRIFLENTTPPSLPKTSIDGFMFQPFTGFYSPAQVLTDYVIAKAQMRDPAATTLTSTDMASPNISGTASAVNALSSNWVRWTSGTTSGNQAGSVWAGAWGRWENEPWVGFNIHIPPNNACSGASADCSANMTFYLCLTATGMVETDNPSLTSTTSAGDAFICFARDEDIAGGNLLVGSANGTNYDFDDTGLAWSADIRVRAMIGFDGTTAYYFWNGNVFTRTANVPTGTGTFDPTLLATTREAEGKIIDGNLMVIARK